MGTKSRSKSKKRSPERPKASSDEVSRRMKATRQRDTPGELSLRAALTALGLRYRVDYRLPGTRRRADVAFPGRKIAVFVDGCFWHGCPEHGTWPRKNADWWREKIEGNRRRDAECDTVLRDAGWRVFRFWSHEEMTSAATSVLRAIKTTPAKVGP
jgi:DNA mismatch endonuclease, patch repair protein